MANNLTSVGFAALTLLAATTNGRAQSSDPYVGELLTVSFKYCPRGWLEADGRTLDPSNFPQLFRLLGTRFGGDGTTSFGLPAIRPPISGNGEPLLVCISLFGVFPSRD